MPRYECNNCGDGKFLQRAEKCLLCSRIYGRKWKGLKGKRVLVTSGGTMEYIDDVRVMTNISSGKLGAIIADKLVEDGADVHYLHSRNAVIPVSPCKLFKITSAMDAFASMQGLVHDMDAVIHCMAVSDFTFKRDKAIKCKSSDPKAFIKYMKDAIKVNPKIISEIKGWNPKTILIGFKFEVGITNKELIALALSSIDKNGCDMVIANDKEEMSIERTHVAYAVLPGASTTKIKGKERIAGVIGDFLMASFEAQELEIGNITPNLNKGRK